MVVSRDKKRGSESLFFFLHPTTFPHQLTLRTFCSTRTQTVEGLSARLTLARLVDREQNYV